MNIKVVDFLVKMKFQFKSMSKYNAEKKPENNLAKQHFIPFPEESSAEVFRWTKNPQSVQLSWIISTFLPTPLFFFFPSPPIWDNSFMVYKPHMLRRSSVEILLRHITSLRRWQSNINKPGLILVKADIIQKNIKYSKRDRIICLVFSDLFMKFLGDIVIQRSQSHHLWQIVCHNLFNKW